MLTVLKIFPHGLNIIIVLKIWIALHILDPTLDETIVDLVHHHAVDTFSPILVTHPHEIEVGAFIAAHGFQKVNKSKREDVSSTFLKCL